MNFGGTPASVVMVNSRNNPFFFFYHRYINIYIHIHMYMHNMYIY